MCAKFVCIDEMISDSPKIDRDTIRNAVSMMLSRGVISCRGMRFEDSASRLRWLITATPQLDRRISLDDYTTGTQPTLILRTKQFYNGRCPNKLLQSCWNDAIDAGFNPDADRRCRRIIIVTDNVKMKRTLVSNPVLPGTAFASMMGTATMPDRLDIFPKTSFRFNIMEHVLVPTHVALSSKSLESFGAAYGNPGDATNASDAKIRKTNEFISSLPRISSLDPVVRFLGGVSCTSPCRLDSGTVYMIHRKGEEPYLRCVVDDLAN